MIAAHYEVLHNSRVLIVAPINHLPPETVLPCDAVNVGVRRGFRAHLTPFSASLARVRRNALRYVPVRLLRHRAMQRRMIEAPSDWQHQALTDARPASRISCDSARSSTARAMTMVPTNVAYVLRAFRLRAAFDVPRTIVVSRSTAPRT